MEGHSAISVPFSISEYQLWCNLRYWVESLYVRELVLVEIQIVAIQMLLIGKYIYVF